MAVAVLSVLFSPMLLAEMPFGTGLMRQNLNSGGFPAGRGQEADPGPSAPQQSQAASTPAPAVSSPADNIADLLSFKDKLGLTGQQVITIQMIAADARIESAKKTDAARECQQEFEKVLSHNNPDFSDIRLHLSKLNEAQADALAVPVDAYEKACAQLTEVQRSNLAFFRGIRQQEIEKKARAAAEASTPQPPPPSTALPPASTFNH